MRTIDIHFSKMSNENPFVRPEFLHKGFTFRNGGGEGDMIFTLLEDYDKQNNNNIHVLCHSLSSNYTHTEIWDDCQYLSGSFQNGEYFPYWKDCDWLNEYYN